MIARLVGPAFAVGASLLCCSRRDGRPVVLLARRAAWVADPGVWGTAGGHQEPTDPDPWTCAVREAAEEFGPGTPAGLAATLRRDLTSPARAGAHGPFAAWPIPHRVYLLPLAAPPPAWPQLNPEHDAAAWWPLDALPTPVAWLPLLALRRAGLRPRPGRAAVWHAAGDQVRRLLRRPSP